MGVIDFFIDLVGSSIKKKKDKEILELEIRVLECDESIDKKLSEELSSGDHFGTWKHWKNDIDQMESKYKRLRERFKHDRGKSLEVTKDWLEYIESAYEIIKYGGFDNFNDDGYQLAMQEIERRFDKLLKS